MTRGESMRNWRVRRGLSQAKLAELSGINASTISALELDRNSGGTMDTIEILADTLGLSIDAYIGHSSKPMDLAEEAALIAAHDIFNISPASAKIFRRCFRHTLRDLNSMMYGCVQDEAHIRHAQFVISNKIKSIVEEK